MADRGPVGGDTVDELLRRWPAAARVFIQHGMACVGCPLSRFESIGDAATSYGLSERSLLRQLRAATAGRRRR